MENLRKINKKETGITLIALVVTIIVLLILAGVTLNIALSNEGLIGRARSAKQTYMQAEQNDLAALEQIDRFAEEEMKDKSAIILVVQSGNDGYVRIPIWNGDDCIIDWGDGTTTNTIESGKNVDKVYKLASLASNAKETFSLAAYPGGYEHTYSESNKLYTVTIKGDITHLGGCYYSKNSLIQVKQWGETGLNFIGLSECSNLNSIASPSQNSFNYITDFSYSFKNCSSLTRIPEDFFKNCSYASYFQGTFYGCTSLENYLPLWQSSYYNGGNTYVSETTAGEGCFYGCNNIVGKESIPEFWKKDISR